MVSSSSLNAFVMERLESKEDAAKVPLKEPDTIAPKEKDEKREKWGRKVQFILACVGYAVGLGNVWRFPYLCYKSGGGAFLIPYFLMLILCGIPLLLMELGVGQYCRLGPVGAFKKLCPLLKGTGAATVMITFLLTTYYNVIIAWAIFYLIASFQEELPWNKCNQTWNTDDCFSHQDYIRLGPGNKPNNTVASTQEYYDYRVLDISSGIDDPGGIRGELVGLLVLAWIFVYLCLFKGVASSGKVVYFTATFPYAVLTALLINGVMLDGAVDGIKFFLFPEWEKLKDADVWVAAAAQNFNSIGIAFGSMIALSSYNEFHSNTLLRDTFIVSLLNSFTSVFASFVIFSVIGYIAHVQGADDIGNVVTDGPGLVFVVYPAAFDTMPVPQLWSALFFVMLICLGIDSQFAMVEVVVATFQDGFPFLRKFYFNRKEVLVAYICIITFFLGLPNVTRGGIYFFQLMDWYTAVVSLFFIAICEVAAISWFYGANRLSRNIREMTGSYPNIYFRICWFVLSPLLIVAIMIFNIIDFETVKYGEYEYPSWAEGLGWFFACLSIVWIPIGAIHTLATGQGPIMERFLTSLKSEINERTHGRDLDKPLTVVTCEFPPPYDEVVQGPEDIDMTDMQQGT